MKNIAFSLTLTIAFFLTHDIHAQKKNNYYFNVNNQPVSKGKFNRSKDYRKVIDVKYMQQDSIIHKLVSREESGNIQKNDMELLRNYLKRCTNKNISPNEIIVIEYYPGISPGHSTALGYTDKFFIKSNHQMLSNGLKELGNPTLIYLYKDFAGLEKQKGIVPWHQDIDNGIEELFFNYHYRNGSFVVINTDGNYYAFFGEHSYEQIFGIVEKFKKENGQHQ